MKYNLTVAKLHYWVKSFLSNIMVFLLHRICLLHGYVTRMVTTLKLPKILFIWHHFSMQLSQVIAVKYGCHKCYIKSKKPSLPCEVDVIKEFIATHLREIKQCHSSYRVTSFQEKPTDTVNSLWNGPRSTKQIKGMGLNIMIVKYAVIY